MTFGLAGEYTSFGALSAIWDLNPAVDRPQTARFDYGMVAAGDLRMSYDGFDQLREVGHLPDAGAQAQANASGTQDSGAASVRHFFAYDGARAYSQGPDGTRRFFFADLTEHDGVREQQIFVEGRPQAIVKLSAEGRQTNWRYQHSGLAPGASMITDTHGQMAQTRLFEPFSAAISDDFSLNRRSAANMPRDSLTGWSDHGARWQAPQFASWLSVDRPSPAPSADAIAAFWDRHPYQVNRQNPNLFHDPDGNAASLATGAMGFAAGSVLGSIPQTGISLYRGETLSLQAIGTAAAGGASSGGIAGFTCGTSLLMEAGGIATGSPIGGMTSHAITGDTITAISIAVDLGVGAVPFGLAEGASHPISSITLPTSMVIFTKLDRTSAILAHSASRQALIEKATAFSRLPADVYWRITKAAHSIAKKDGHRPDTAGISVCIEVKPTQANAETIVTISILSQKIIKTRSINADLLNENRRMGLSSEDLPIKTFLDKRIP